jgi:hypothetical protein
VQPDEDDEAGLVGDVEDQRLSAVGVAEDGLGALVADGRGVVPRDVAEARDGVALEQDGAEGELCVADVVVAEDTGLLGFCEEAEGRGGL